MVFQKQLSVATRGHRDLHDLTDAVGRVIAESKVRTGVAHVFVVGSTVAVGTIEFEPGLRRDLPELLDRLRMAPHRLAKGALAHALMR